MVKLSRGALVLLVVACSHDTPKATTPTSAVQDASSDADAAPHAELAAVLGCTAPASFGDAARLQGLPRPKDSQWDIIASPADAHDVCATAESNLRAAARAILSAPDDGAQAAHTPWDRTTAPALLDKIADRLALSTREKQAITEHSFAALESKSYASYTDAFHDVYERELPIYVSIDAVLHAIFESNDGFIADLEHRKLLPALTQALASMHGALKAAAPSYPHDAAADADLYLAVARTLLTDAPVAPVLGPQPQVAELVAAVKRAADMPTVQLFGRDRVIDFSQYKPRGHYDKSPDLRRFFRAAMWCSRLELNLVSRSSRSSQPGTTPNPAETPREDVDALVLADLATRSKADAKIAELDKAWGLLAGVREDVSVADIQKLAIDPQLPDAADRLRRTIGTGFKRTVRFHYMPEGSTELPAIATMLGPRIVPDSQAVMHLVHSAIPDRHHVMAEDFAYALGHDRAKTYLAADLAKYPALGSGLEAARKDVMQPLACTDLYSSWLGAIRALAEKPAGVTPSLMSTPAFADSRIASVVAGYGQIRHNYVLVAAQTYDEAGCEIPDGWVDPAIGTYDALLVYAARGAEVSKQLGAPSDERYFERLGTILAVLRRIAHDELAGRALTDDEKRFLSMVVEMTPGETGALPTFTGWYLEMFRTLEEAQADASFVADVFTSSDSGEIDYVGSRGPELGVFVVDAGGGPRAFVGPVTRAYEHAGSASESRLTDAAARKLTTVESPWSASYTVHAEPSVPLVAKLVFETGAWTLRTKEPHEAILEALDHHNAVIGSVTVQAGPRTKAGVLRHKGTIERVRVKIGEYAVQSGEPFVMDDSANIDTMKRE